MEYTLKVWVSVRLPSEIYLALRRRSAPVEFRTLWSLLELKENAPPFYFDASNGLDWYSSKHRWRRISL